MHVFADIKCVDNLIFHFLLAGRAGGGCASRPAPLTSRYCLCAARGVSGADVDGDFVAIQCVSIKLRIGF